MDPRTYLKGRLRVAEWRQVFHVVACALSWWARDNDRMVVVERLMKSLHFPGRRM